MPPTPIVISETKLVRFDDGEAAAVQDLDAVSDGAKQMAFEYPHYSDLFPHSPLAASYEDLLDGGVGLDKMAFVKNGGCAVKINSAFEFRLGSGMIGGYDVTEPNDDSGFHPGSLGGWLKPRMAWAYIPKNQVQFTLATPATGDSRYDLLTVSFAVEETDEQTVDFQDDTTAALSTHAAFKRRTTEATFTITEGTPSSGTPTRPSLPANEHLVAVILVNDSSIETIDDHTFPLSPPRVCAPALRNLALWDLSVVRWSARTGGGIICSNAQTVYIPVPPEFAGDPTARLLGFRMKYLLTSGSNVTLGKIIMGEDFTGGNFTPLKDVSAQFTFDASARDDVADVRGFDDVSADYGPVWCQGATFKEWPKVAAAGTCLALAVSSFAASDAIDGITWYIVKG